MFSPHLYSTFTIHNSISAMKKIIFLLCASIFMLSATPALAGPKMDKRHAYVLKNLELDKKTEAALSPVLMQYLQAKKEANKKYDDLKDKYKSAEKAGTLTNAQATELLNAKFERDAKELAVKKRYYTEFLKILKPKTVWYVFDLSNDKKEKIDGKD